MMKEKEKRLMMNNYYLIVLLGILITVLIYVSLGLVMRNMYKSKRHEIPKNLLKPKNQSDDWVEEN